MLRDNPRADLPGRIVSHMLGVRALEVRNPVPFLVLVKTHDTPEHYGETVGEPGPGRSSM